MWNAFPIFRDALRVTCAAVAIVLSATSCFEQQSAERRPLPRSVPDRPADPDRPVSVAGQAPAGARAIPARPAAFVRDPGAPMEQGDAWERVRLLMSLAPVGPEVSSLREFRKKLRRYHGNQRFFDHIGDRARPWLYHITRELAARGMPGELALLPAVESGYDPSAVSSQDAAGLWQIIPLSAREFRLPRSRWYDARHDIPASTTAALDYLAALRDAFHGDWLLAVAAYNCGPGNVRRAIRRAGLRIETATADYAAIERHLPRETRSHVARWLVLSEIVAMPRLHNVRLEAIPWRPYFTVVSTNSQIDLANAARRARVSPAAFSVLNPGLLHGMTPPNGPHRVLVPAEQADRIRRGLSRTYPVRVVGEGLRYRIREGDTLGLIARAHDTTVTALMAANRLDSHLIRAGRELLIPAPVRGGSSGKPSSGGEEANFGVHVVSRGDTLWLVARQYRTTVRSLRDWNRLPPGADLLRPGQQLRVRGKG